MPPSTSADRADLALRSIALSYPGTTEHFPWGHRTIKVRDKAFVFQGVEDGSFFFTTKLPDSRHVALLLPFAEPTGYGLGKSGWVTATFPAGSEPPVDMLASWLDESFRAVAPARVVATLPASGPPTGAAASAGPAMKAKAAAKAKPAKAAAKVKETAKAKAKPTAKPAKAKAKTKTKATAKPKAKTKATAKPKAKVKTKKTAKPAKAKAAPNRGKRVSARTSSRRSSRS